MNSKTLSASVFWSVLHTHHVLAEGLTELLKKVDLSTEQYMVLEILHEKSGAVMSMSEIQRKMIFKTSNTTRLIDKLLGKALVTREVCANNRRKIDVAITAKGVTCLGRIARTVGYYQEKFASRLKEGELKSLAEILIKYQHNQNT